jgi:hypothetical protein
MKKFLICALGASSLLVGVPTSAQVVNGGGIGQPAPAGNCLAVERASRNSKGGDRANGVFGAAQESFTAQFATGFTWEVTGVTYYDYGQFLKDWKALYCS